MAAWNRSVTPLIGLSQSTGTKGPVSRSSAKVAMRSASGWVQKAGSTRGDEGTGNDPPAADAAQTRPDLGSGRVLLRIDRAGNALRTEKAREILVDGDFG